MRISLQTNQALVLMAFLGAQLFNTSALVMVWFPYPCQTTKGSLASNGASMERLLRTKLQTPFLYQLQLLLRTLSFRRPCLVIVGMSPERSSSLEVHSVWHQVLLPLAPARHVSADVLLVHTWHGWTLYIVWHPLPVVNCYDWIVQWFTSIEKYSWNDFTSLHLLLPVCFLLLLCCFPVLVLLDFVALVSSALSLFLFSSSNSCLILRFNCRKNWPNFMQCKRLWRSYWGGIY